MEEQIIKRIAPNDREAEKAVIGSMLMDREAISAAMERVHEDDFYHKEYGLVFRAVCELFNEGKAVDMVTVQERVKRYDAPGEVGSMAFMRDIMEYIPSSANIAEYASIVASKAVLRRLIGVAENIENKCYAGSESLDNILDATEKDVFGLLMNRAGGETVGIDKVTMDVINTIESAARNHNMVTGISTGFRDLDVLTLGLQRSDLILVAARPSMGKTAFVLNLAQNMAVKHDKYVAFFSLEMSKEQLVTRILSMESGIDSKKLRNGNMSDSEWASLVESAGAVAQSHIIIDDTPSIDIGRLRAKCRKLALEKKLDIIMIDYLQLMSGDRSTRRSSDSRQQEVSEISRALKGLARELNVPVIALSQLSRAVESRPDKHPMLSDLRESGAIEQDADIVMFLYREDYYKKDSERKNIGEVIIAKQRNGGLGTVELAWIPDRTKFANLEKNPQMQQ